MREKLTRLWQLIRFRWYFGRLRPWQRRMTVREMQRLLDGYLTTTGGQQ